eukprot:CAMPEP_0184720946 /NCGR_PEP_ID=MMETSP0314-20130426/15951_1 /TAXON_ID=38298 /ORGANISM="Rhodella maculata, Strain CCMP 736" /LENGTH=75 /DNA_ID=CAMNT_0027185181 /DNA_START=120 /DNA_END=344 /DNA_ORIENTATION=-
MSIAFKAFLARHAVPCYDFPPLEAAKPLALTDSPTGLFNREPKPPPSPPPHYHPADRSSHLLQPHSQPKTNQASH